MILLAVDLLLALPLFLGGVSLSLVSMFLPTAWCFVEFTCLALAVQRRRIVLTERGILSDRLMTTKFYPWASIQEIDWREREGSRTLVSRVVPEPGKTAQVDTIDLKFLTVEECRRFLEVIRQFLPGDVG